MSLTAVGGARGGWGYELPRTTAEREHVMTRRGARRYMAGEKLDETGDKGGA